MQLCSQTERQCSTYCPSAPPTKVLLRLENAIHCSAIVSPPPRRHWVPKNAMQCISLGAPGTLYCASSIRQCSTSAEHRDAQQIKSKWWQCAQAMQQQKSDNIKFQKISQCIEWKIFHKALCMHWIKRQKISESNEFCLHPVQLQLPQQH